MKTYKIDSSKISEYSNRNGNRVFKIIVFSLIFTVILMVIPMIQRGEASSAEIYSYIFSLVLTSIIVLYIYRNNKKFVRLTAENLQIIIDDKYLLRVIDLEKESRLNFIHKIGYERSKNTSGYYSKIEFEKIENIEIKNGDLYVKSIGSNLITGTGIVLIPKELNNFEELKNEIYSRKNN